MEWIPAPTGNHTDGVALGPHQIPRCAIGDKVMLLYHSQNLCPDRRTDIGVIIQDTGYRADGDACHPRNILDCHVTSSFPVSLFAWGSPTQIVYSFFAGYLSAGMGAAVRTPPGVLPREPLSTSGLLPFLLLSSLAYNDTKVNPIFGILYIIFHTFSDLSFFPTEKVIVSLQERNWKRSRWLWKRLFDPFLRQKERCGDGRPQRFFS
ncbi:MAG: hypothetical protein LUC39_03395 [Clostridiales bacterium]|nr:hypothetical protein [Clostridiales bacterium]